VLTGRSEHAIDDKGRVVIPPKYRNYLGNVLVLTLGFEGCLVVYKLEHFQELSEELKKLNYLKGNARSLQRLLLYGAEICEVDKQGRVLLPQTHREYAKINKDIVLVGLIDKLEIWAKERWQEFLEEKSPNYEALAEEIGDLKL